MEKNNCQDFTLNLKIIVIAAHFLTYTYLALWKMQL